MCSVFGQDRTPNSEHPAPHLYPHALGDAHISSPGSVCAAGTIGIIVAAAGWA